MSEETQDMPRPVPVIPVGDSWVICKSKSHPNHIYYFNRATGDAVWNISKTEIEKARKRTQNILEHHGIAALSYPSTQEPKENPPTFVIPRQLEKREEQLVHNQFGHQDSDNIIFRQAPELNIIQTQDKPTTVYTDLQVNNVPTFELNTVNKQITAYNLVNPALINGNAWSIPHRQQFIITPAIPVVNQAQQPVNIPYHGFIQTESVNNDRLTSFQNAATRRNNISQSNNMFWHGGRKYNNSLRNNDLRQRITLRRELSNGSSRTVTSFEVEHSNECGLPEEDVGNQKECKINESPETETEEKQLYDLTPLKDLSSSNCNPDIWYIVVDLDVLLEDFQYIHNLIESDERCHLMVPEKVLTELKTLVSSSNNVQARRIFQALSRKIGSGCAIVAEQSDQDYGDIITHPTLNICLGLIEQNYHVIFLTKDNELLKCKKFIKINMFTVNEVRSLIQSSTTSTLTKQTPSSPPTLPPKKLSSETPFAARNLNKGTIPNRSVSVETRSEVQDILSFKRTVETAIQTDTASIMNYGANRKTVSDKSQHNPANSEKSKDSVSLPPVIATHNLPFKRREIKLKRTTSNPPIQPSTVVKNNEKKPFRWRRKRNINNEQATEPERSHEKSYLNRPQNVDSCLQIKTLSNNFENQVEPIVNENELNKASDSRERVESRESSVICTEARTEHITIDETSTSGIISNTESNTESEYIAHKKLPEETYDEHETNKIVTFEVDCENMEESLKTKCDEWISRFTQIMEEVLSIILHKHLKFSNSAMPPPWNLHEAVQCIRKCSSNRIVTHVTDELSNILCSLSDSTGKLNTNITPQQYMKLYSYGVSLLRALKDTTTNCEDVDIAEDFLEKLLSDIKKPYWCSNDSVIDPQEHPSLNQVPHIAESAKSDIQKELFLTPSITQPKYNLRSRSKKSVADEHEKQSPLKQPVKFIRNIDIKQRFLENFMLKKVTENNIIKTNESRGSLDKATEPNHLSFSSSSVKSESIRDKPVNEPRIIRNFTICPEFEEKLKLNSDLYEGDDKYSEYEEDYESMDYRLDDCNTSKNSELASDPNVTQIFEPSDLDTSADLTTSSPGAVDPAVATDANITFKFMMCMFLQEVRKAINEVKVLCDKCYAELESPKLPKNERNELRNRVENAHLHIVGLCISLENMLARNPNAPIDNIHTALKKAGVNMSQIDEQLLLSYCNTIANCKKHADIFLFSIREIIAAFESLSG